MLENRLADHCKIQYKFSTQTPSFSLLGVIYSATWTNAFTIIIHKINDYFNHFFHVSLPLLKDLLCTFNLYIYIIYKKVIFDKAIVNENICQESGNKSVENVEHLLFPQYFTKSPQFFFQLGLFAF
jgi:hypothetical protein